VRGRFEGKDHYRDLFTDAEALSLTFSTTDVPLIVREGTARTSIHYFCYFIRQSRRTQTRLSIRRIPSPFPGSSSLLSPSSSEITRRPVLTSATVAGGFAELITSNRNDLYVDAEMELHSENIPA